MTNVDVPDEMAAQFRDALDRPCFVCGHPIRAHVSTSKCRCCSKGTRMPSEAAQDTFSSAQVIIDEARKRGIV